MQVKPFLSVADQVHKLRRNGLVLTETQQAQAARFLADHNYYRVSGYFRSFQVNPAGGQNQFIPGASFEKIRAAYAFDRALATQLAAGVAEFEIVFRSRLAYLMAQSAGPDSYLCENTYQNPGGARDRLITTISGELHRSTERFIAHHHARGQAVPVWAAVEALSLGTTSKMYGLIQDVEGVFKPLAGRFGLSHRAARKTFRAMAVLRNVCAHHGRLWNRSHGIDLEAPRAVQTDTHRGIYRNTPWAWAVTLAHLVDHVRGDASYSASLWVFLKGQPAWLCDGLTCPSPR